MNAAIDTVTLLQRLHVQRRDRLARNGDLGPVIKALHDIADLLESDRWKTRRAGLDMTDYMLLMRACYGPLIAWNRRTGRYDFTPCPLCGSTLLDRRHRPQEALARAETLLESVVDALGAESGTPLPQVRATADRLAAEAMPLPADMTTAA